MTLEGESSTTGGGGCATRRGSWCPPPQRLPSHPMKHRARPAIQAARHKQSTSPLPAARDSARAAASRILPGAAELLDPRAPYLVPLSILLATRIAAWIAIGGAAEDAY